MKNTLFLTLFLLLGLSILSCEDDTDPVAYDYHAHIMQPSTADKNMGDVLFIEVEFESHTGEAVEHINIRIRDKSNGSVVYNKPADAHLVNDVSDFTFTDQVTLSSGNGFAPGDWEIEASVWGMEEGQDLVTEVVEFHIHP